MKFPKLLFFLPLMSVVITSCSSDDSKSDPVVAPPVIDLANQKLISFSYPYDPYIGIRRDDESYEYDNTNKIVKVKEGGYVYGITYVSPDLIEVNQLEDNLTGFKIISKRSIHLKAGSVESIINNEIFVSETNSEISSVSSDSTVFTYKNQYISKVESYRKSKYYPTYRLGQQVDFEEQNGNITKAVIKSVLAGTSYTINYTYDSDAYVKGSDYTYETPLLYSYYTLFSVLHNKFGKKSTNNIVKIDHEYTDSKPSPRSFKTMTLRRILDSEKRLKEIVVSGTTFDDLKNYVGLDFKDAKGTFTYK
ncbi:hypothetical protein [Flavobacterium sp. PS2]|uniref:hypothetical protein n=1 Tax=Flavobacterium sp. PS2 TaxID=3384157 RepID=UPI00390CD68D